jgi:hypothetical protein
MSTNALVAVFCFVGITSGILGMILSLLRLRESRDSLPLESLTRQAAPTKQSINIVQILSAACLFVAFAIDYFDDPRGMRSMLVFVAVAMGPLMQFVQRLVQRTSALEGIIKLSLPDVYAKIRDEEG